MELIKCYRHTHSNSVHLFAFTHLKEGFVVFFFEAKILTVKCSSFKLVFFGNI